MSDTEDRETCRLAADVVLFSGPADDRCVLLIQRGWPPFEGAWALPGGHVDRGETTEAAARRELVEETGVNTTDLIEVGTYSDPGRDPRGRYVSVAYAATLPTMTDATAGDDARAAAWVPVADVLAGRVELAFDHLRILTDATAVPAN